MGSLRVLGCAVACAIALFALPATALAGPTATIAAPATGATWAAGQPIPVAGSALGASGRRLSRWSLRWTLSLRSCSDDGHCYLKRLADLTGSSGTFTAPDRSRPAQLVVSLTATDFDGTTDTETVSLDAQTSTIELTTSPPGMTVSLDDETGAAPLQGTFVVGSHVDVDAPEPQTLLGYDYAFGAWSGGFAESSEIAVPDDDATYDASFRFTGRRTLLGSDAVADDTASAEPGGSQPYRLLAARSGTVDRLRVYVDPSNTASQLTLGLYADAAGVPGALLGSGTTSAITPGAWNEVGLDPLPKLAVGRMYWVSVGNTGTGTLVWRDASTYGVGPAPAPPDHGVDVEPGRLSFATAAGGDDPPSQSLVVQANSGGCGPCAWQISDDASWLSVTPTSGDWPTRVTASADAGGLAPGIYRATIQVSRGADGDATSIPVVFKVAAPADHLMGAWSFDESGADSVSDSSGHGNDGTIAGAVRTTGGLAGGALAFAGDGLITVPDSASLDFTSGLTVEGWVRPNVLAGAVRALAVKRDDDDTATWGLFAADSLGLPSGSAVTDAESRARGSAKVSLTPVWTHLATTYDGTTVRLYLNGRLAASAPQSGPLTLGSGPLEIGAGFDGLIDEVRVYDRALTAGEIQLDLATPISPA